MSFSPQRMASKLQSRVIRQPVASGTFQFMKEGKVDSGSTAIAISTTVFAADETAKDYVAAVVDLPTLFQNATRIADANQFDLLVFAKDAPAVEPIYAWRGKNSDLKQANKGLRLATAEDQSATVDFGRQPWTIVRHPRPAFYANSSVYGSRLTLAAGLAMTLLIILAIYPLQHHRRKIEHAETRLPTPTIPPFPK